MNFRRCVQSLVVVLALGLAFGAEAPASAADTLLVPDDFPTIQDAVDAANPAGGDTVMVGPGDYAGAVITNPVKIVGCGNETRITSGTWAYSEDAFDLVGIFFDADGTEISNLVIEYDGLGFGVYGYQVDKVTISNVTINDPEYHGILVVQGDAWTVDGNAINNASRAIDFRYSSGCTINHNSIIGLVPSAGPGEVRHCDGIFVGEGSANLISHNYVYHVGSAVGGYSEEMYVGVGLLSLGGPTEDNNVHHNRIEVSVPDADYSGALYIADWGARDYGYPVALINNKAMHNNLCGSYVGLDFSPDDLPDYNNRAKFNLCAE
jgi:hypothetical protein